MPAPAPGTGTSMGFSLQALPWPGSETRLNARALAGQGAGRRLFLASPLDTCRESASRRSSSLPQHSLAAQFVPCRWLLEPEPPSYQPPTFWFSFPALAERYLMGSLPFHLQAGGHAPKLCDCLPNERQVKAYFPACFLKGKQMSENRYPS